MKLSEDYVVVVELHYRLSTSLFRGGPTEMTHGNFHLERPLSSLRIESIFRHLWLSRCLRCLLLVLLAGITWPAREMADSKSSHNHFFFFREKEKNVFVVARAFIDVSI